MILTVIRRVRKLKAFKQHGVGHRWMECCSAYGRFSGLWLPDCSYSKLDPDERILVFYTVLGVTQPPRFLIKAPFSQGSR